MRRALPLVLLACLALPAPALARPGDVDTSFAAGRGSTAFALGVDSAHVAGLALRPDGRPLIAGTASADLTSTATTFAQLDPTGVPDPAFATSGTALVDPVPVTDVQPGGLVLGPAGGAIAVTTVRDPETRHQVIHVVRVLPKGGLDPLFGDGGVSILSFENGDLHADDVAMDAPGRILIAASSVRDGRHYMSAFRLLPDGTRDPRFAGGRVDVASRAIAGAILPRPGGGAFVAGGTRRSYGNLVVVEVNDRGRRLDRFAGGRSHVRLANHTRAGTGARDMVFGPGGTLVVACLVRAVGVRDRVAVVRLTSHGHLDTSFGAGGVFIAGTQSRPLTVQHMVKDGSGRFLLTGTAKTPATGAQRAFVLRLTSGGHADTRFGSGGAVVRRLGGSAFVDSRATSVAVANRRVWLAGVAFDAAGRSWPAVMRLLG